MFFRYLGLTIFRFFDGYGGFRMNYLVQTQRHPEIFSVYIPR